VSYPRLTHLKRPDARQDGSLGQRPIAHHHGSMLRGALALVSLQILLDFVLDGRLQHLARAIGDELFQGTLGFCSLLERDHVSFFQRRILSLAAASGEAARCFGYRKDASFFTPSSTTFGHISTSGSNWPHLSGPEIVETRDIWPAYPSAAAKLQHVR
jgi:hypothetical protein